MKKEILEELIELRPTEEKQYDGILRLINQRDGQHFDLELEAVAQAERQRRVVFDQQDGLGGGGRHEGGL